MRLIGIPIDSPQRIAMRVLSDLGAISRAAREVPGQFDRLLDVGEEIAAIGRSVLEITERLDQRADAILELGTRLEASTSDLIALGARMHALGDRVDARGVELTGQATDLVETATELIAALPTLERALEMATPLEGAIDRFGRLIDRLPGGRRLDAPPVPAAPSRRGIGSAPGRAPVRESGTPPSGDRQT